MNGTGTRKLSLVSESHGEGTFGGFEQRRRKTIKSLRRWRYVTPFPILPVLLYVNVSKALSLTETTTYND